MYVYKFGRLQTKQMVLLIIILVFIFKPPIFLCMRHIGNGSNNMSFLGYQSYQYKVAHQWFNRIGVSIYRRYCRTFNQEQRGTGISKMKLVIHWTILRLPKNLVNAKRHFVLLQWKIKNKKRGDIYQTVI